MEFNRVTTHQQAQELIKMMPDVIAIDTEFVKGDPRATKLLSVIVADGDRAWAFPPSLLPMLTSTIRARKLIFLQDYNHCDTIILLKHGCDLRGSNVHNLIDMHHLLDENADHSLDARCRDRFRDDYKTTFWGKYKDFENAPEDEAIEYSCKDAIYTYRLGSEDLVTIDSEWKNGLCELYYHVRELSSALLDTELNGINVDVKLMTDTKQSMEEQINDYLPKLRSQFQEYCEIWEMQEWIKKIEKLKTSEGRTRVPRPAFSFESDAQLRALLYGRDFLGLPVTAVTKKKAPSTAYEALKEVAKSNPEIQKIVEYKDLKGVYATFVKGMLERVQDGKIYPHFNVSGTATGRISHSDPNMGNLPKDGVIRNFFIPSPGNIIIGADYEQLEVVIELNLTEDPGLKEIVCGGASKHDLFKDDLDRAGFNIPRSQVKNINFALQYGAGENKIAKMVGCSSNEAGRIIDTFYTRFSGVKRLKEETNVRIKRDGQITNLAGRTRRFSKPDNKFELFRQQRQAYNFLIQGVAGEACNRAYYRFHNWLKDNGGRGLFPVHDEIVCEVYGANPQDPYWYMNELVYTMEQSTQDFNFKYPLKAKAYGPLNFWTKT